MDGGFCRLFIADNDLLHGAAEGDLNGDGIVVGGADELGDRSVDAPQDTLFALLHDHADGLGEALKFPFHLLKELQPGGDGVQGNGGVADLLLQRIAALGAGLAAQAVALNGILGGGDVLPGLR